MKNHWSAVDVSLTAVNPRKSRIGFVTALVAVLLFTQHAFASQLVLNANGGTLSLGTDFILSGASVSSPAGTVSFDCPITSTIVGTYVITYYCSGGSYSYQSTDSTTNVSAPFTSGTIYLTAAGGGKGGNIKYTYQFFGNFSGTETISGVTAAITGEATLTLGGLTSQLGSAPAGSSAAGVNSAYIPVYLTDYSNSQLIRSDDLSGTNEVKLGTTGTGANHFYGPHGLTLDSSGRVYVVDTYNCRIVRVDDISGKNWTNFGTCGSGTNQFKAAADIALDSTGRIYVADTGNSRIVRFDNMTGTNWTAFGTAGSGTNQFSGAQGITVDSANNIYIADTGNKRLVQIADMTGTNWTVLTQSPVINGYIFSFGSPAHVALDNVGRIVVGDGTNVIRVDDMTGTNWTSINLKTSVAGVAVGIDGTTYVAGSISSGGNGVAIFDDITTGAGYFGNSLVGDPGGIFPVPVPNPVPAVKLSATNLAFGQANAGTVSAPQNVTLTNFGSAPLNLTIAASADFTATSTCPTSLPGGSNCTITVSYAPTVTGAETGAITISDNAFTGTQTISLSGTGTAPVPGVSPSSVAFQPQLLNTSSSAQFVVLSNSGTGPLTFSGSGISTTGDFAQSNNCGSALAAGLSCLITLTYTPTIAGAETGSLLVVDNAGTQSVGLSGTGSAGAPTITVSPESLVFPIQLVGTRSASQTVVLTNTGTATVSLTSVAVTGDFTKTGICPTTLRAGKSCTLKITFAPTAGGTRTGALTFALSSGGVSVGLMGTGAPTPTAYLMISPASLSFPGYVVGDNPSQNLTVTNSNGIPLGITKITKSGSTAFTQSNNCGNILAANASCTVTVTFTPTAVGSYAGTLSITESAGTVHKIPLSGTAVVGN